MAKKLNKQIIERENDLTYIQWRIYDFLNEQEGLIPLKKIYEEFKMFYPYFDSEKTTWNNATARRMITDDLNAIANSQNIYKVLITSPSGVGFLSKEESIKWLESEEKRLVAEWKKLKHQQKKAGLNLQTRLVFASEKDTIHSFKTNND